MPGNRDARTKELPIPPPLHLTLVGLRMLPHMQSSHFSFFFFFVCVCLTWSKKGRLSLSCERGQRKEVIVCFALFSVSSPSHTSNNFTANKPATNGPAHLHSVHHQHRSPLQVHGAASDRTATPARAGVGYSSNSCNYAEPTVAAVCDAQRLSEPTLGVAMGLAADPYG